MNRRAVSVTWKVRAGEAKDAPLRATGVEAEAALLEPTGAVVMALSTISSVLDHPSG